MSLQCEALFDQKLSSSANGQIRKELIFENLRHSHMRMRMKLSEVSVSLHFSDTFNDVCPFVESWNEERIPA